MTHPGIRIQMKAWLASAALILFVAILAPLLVAAAEAPVDIVFSPDQNGTQLTAYRNGGAAPVPLGLGDMVGDGVVSPDGTRVAFLDIAGNDIGLSIANLDGTGRKSLITLPVILSPAWAPDGKRLIFISVDIAKKQTALHLINADGSGHQQVAVPVLEGMATPPTIYRPHLSHDGRQALVTATTTTWPRALAIDLGTNRGRYIAQGFDATWSPDGRHLAYVQSPTKEQSVLYVAAADGSGAKPVQAQRAITPVWSRDGSRLYFNVFTGDSLQVWSTAPDGANAAQVTAIPDGALLSVSSKQMILTLMRERQKQTITP